MKGVRMSRMRKRVRRKTMVMEDTRRDIRMSNRIGYREASHM
jgi:hypothetical protein